MSLPKVPAANPKYFNILTPYDQAMYYTLHQSVWTRQLQNNWNQRGEVFADILKLIRMYCVRGDADDWKRSLVCGVCWTMNGLGINIRQLKELVNRCKSSINGSLQRLGLDSVMDRTGGRAVIARAMPLLETNLADLKEWSVRKYVKLTDSTKHKKVPVMEIEPHLPEQLFLPEFVTENITV